MYCAHNFAKRSQPSRYDGLDGEKAYVRVDRDDQRGHSGDGDDDR